MTFVRTLLIMILLSLPYAAAAERQSITLQMQWKHQFEYAGFYAAVENGFYDEAGLDVTLKEYHPGLNILNEVLEGRAQYGVIYSSLVADYLKGAPVVMLANFFKHSALVLVTQPDIVTPNDLKGKTVMGNKDELLSSPIALMLDKFGLGVDDLKLVPPTFRLDEFKEKKIDAMTTFITNETFELDRQKIRYNILNPASYSSQFYDVNLFTSQDELQKHPDRVRAFTRATIRGWHYALAHPDEIIDLILAKYNTQHKSREALEFEAEMTARLILPDIYPLGSIEKKIVEGMAKNYKKMGIVPPDADRDFDPFIYKMPGGGESILFSKTEREYLDHKKSITMCVDPDWMPYEKLEKGRHIGIVADYYKILETKIGIPITVVPTKSWSESIANAKAGRCDLLSLLMQTPERSKYVNVTTSIFDAPSVIATRNDQIFVNRLEDILTQPVGVVRGYADAEILRRRYPTINLVEVSDVHTGLEMVESGKLFGYIDTLPVLAYTIQKDFTGELKISGKFDDRQEHGIGVRNDDPVLFSIIDKAAASISDADRQEILGHWISIIYEQHFDYAVFWKIGAGVLLLTLLILYRQRTLARYNRELSAEVKRQVEELRRKDDIMLRNYQMAVMGEMIGVIAHQIKQPLSTIGLTVQDMEEAYLHGELDHAYIQKSIDNAMQQIDFMSLTIDDLKNYFSPNKAKKEFNVAETLKKSLHLLSKQYMKYNITTTIDSQACYYYGIESELQQIILNVTNNAKEALVAGQTPDPRITVRCRADTDKNQIVITIEDNAGGIDDAVMDKIFDAYFTTKGDAGTGVGLYMVRKMVKECFNGTISAENTQEGARFSIRLPLQRL